MKRFLLYLQTVDIGKDMRDVYIKDGHVKSIEEYDTIEDVKQRICKFLKERMVRIIVEGDTFKLPMIVKRGVEGLVEMYNDVDRQESVLNCFDWYKNSCMDIVDYSIYDREIEGDDKRVVLKTLDDDLADYCDYVFNYATDFYANVRRGAERFHQPVCLLKQEIESSHFLINKMLSKI
jgi:hypothetical protein